MNSVTDTLAGGFPHSEISGSKFARNSPELIAACYVLHRLLAPRHPPNALLRLISLIPSRELFPLPVRTRAVSSLCNHARLGSEAWRSASRAVPNPLGEDWSARRILQSDTHRRLFGRGPCKAPTPKASSYPLHHVKHRGTVHLRCRSQPGGTARPRAQSSVHRTKASHARQNVLHRSDKISIVSPSLRHSSLQTSAPGDLAQIRGSGGGGRD